MQKRVRCAAVVGRLVVGGLAVGGALAACGRVSSGGPASARAASPTTSSVAGSTATSAPGPGDASPVLIVRAFDGTVGYEGREPTTIGFSRDSTNIVTHLTWSWWGPATAVGHGLLGVDKCEPSCAAGTVTQVAATVDLSKVANGHFTAMTEKAGSLSHSYSYPSDWAASAS